MSKPLDGNNTSNDLAYRIGRITREVGLAGNLDGVGDEIDRGLILLRKLREIGLVVTHEEAKK